MRHAFGNTHRRAFELLGQLRPILSNSRIFGSDLVSLGMDKLIEEMFISEIEGTGAVRNTLKKYLDGNK